MTLPDPSLTAAASHPLAASRRGIVMLAALTVFAPLSVDLYLPALPQIAQSLGATTAQVQQTLTAFLAGFCVGMLIYGPLSDAIGRRPVALFGTGLFMAASMACAIAPSVEWLTTFRFIQALGGGATAVMGRTMVRDVFPRSQVARALSLVALVTAITPLLAPLMGGQILRFTEWRTIFYLLGGYSTGVLVLIWFWIPESHPAERRSSLHFGKALAAYGNILRSPAAWGCLIGAGGIFGAMFAYIAGTPFIYIDYFGISPQAYGLFFALNIVSQMIGTSLNSRFLSRLGLVRMSRLGTLAAFIGGSVVLLAALTEFGGIVTIAAGLTLVVGITGLISSNTTARMMALFPHSAGTAAATITAGSFAVGTLTSTAVGLYHGGTPVGMAVVVFLGCALSLLGTSRFFMPLDQ